LRLLEEEEKKLDALAKMLEAGEQSGIANNFDPEEHLNSLKHRK
ncbi:MAG: type II toxin-antitoxin system ParD family antitoxin, partial [Bacteroidota bacterium]